MAAAALCSALAKKSLVLGEGQIARLGGVGGCESGQADGAVSHDFSPQFPGKLGGGQHGNGKRTENFWRIFTGPVR